MDNSEILAVAMRQSALELGCHPEDFTRGTNIVVAPVCDCRARKYLKLPFSCQLVSYGSNIVASVIPELAEPVRRYLDTYPAEHCFETPHLHALEKILRPHRLSVCHMAEYFLPDTASLADIECCYPVKFLGPEALSDLYRPEWSNALCRERAHLDRLALGAYDGDRLIGLAGASADCDTMWQIGIDVLPEYRRQGVASALTGRLAAEILRRGLVPFYCAAWSNLGSVRNAIRSGFRPAWVELTAKNLEIIEQMNCVNEEKI